MSKHFLDNSTTTTTQHFLSHLLLGKIPNDEIGQQDDPASKTLDDTEQEPPIQVTMNAKETDVSRDDSIRCIISTSSIGTNAFETSSNSQDGNKEKDGDGRDSFSGDDYFDFICENHYAFRDEVDIYRRRGCKFMSNNIDSLETSRQDQTSP
ncbi:hypothetical protein ACHAXS_001473 [Conticribra weissflogii]